MHQAEIPSAQEVIKIINESVKDGAFCFLDLDGHIVSWNHGSVRLYGYLPEEIIGHPVSVLYEEKALADRLPEVSLEEASRTGRFEAETVQVKKDSSKFASNVFITPWRNQNSEIRGFARFARDLSERKRAEAARLADEAKMQSVVEHIIDAVVTINRRGEIESWNSAATKIFGYEKSEVIGRNVKMLMPDPDRSRHDNYISRYLQTGDAKIIGKGREVIGLRKNGATFPMDLAVSEFSMGGERFFTGVVRDITERKRVELELLKAKEAAEAASLAKSAFLANMSHEIRTPLGVVTGFSELLTHPNISSEEKTQYVAMMKRSSDLLSKLINDILDLSKVEAGRLEVRRHDIPLAEILRDARAILSLQADSKGIGLKINVENNVPFFVRTDGLRLRQILINVVGNAIKFTDQGSVDVRVQLAERSPDRARLAFMVSDTGPGIALEKQSKLFSAFSQVDESYTRRHGGTGLGLMLSRHLAMLLGGDVELTASHVGKGSTFTIFIDPGPVKNTNGPSKDVAGEMGAVGIEGIHLNQVRVLLVEDSFENQVLVGRMLSLAGAEVDIASNGLEGIKKTEAGKYHVILMDLQMPVMDGFAATAELRKRGYKGLIMALTAHAQNEERERTLANGFDYHLVKPIGYEEIVRRVAEALERI